MRGSCIVGNRKSYGRIRQAWEEHYGESIPKGLEVCHLCENPPCRNPAHLFLATKSANHVHAAQSGRKITTPTLTPEQVRAIRARFKMGGISQARLAEQYNVTQGTISRVVRKSTWKHHMSRAS